MNHKKIAEITKNYVLAKSNGNSTKLEYYLNEWKYRKPNNISELYRNLLMHAQNRQGMPNSIGDIENLRKFLFDFEPKKVYNSYEDWTELFNTINNDYTPPGRMVIDNPRSYWVIFTKSMLSTSKFLSKFDNLKSFEKYVNQFVRSDNIDLRVSLPLLISEELFGFRFALACDFIKENISPEFVKPDVHIKDIFEGIGICKANDSDFEVFRKVVEFAGFVDKKPYWIDKLFWLVGSKTFYRNEKYSQEEKIKTSKKELIEILKNEAR